MEHGYGYKPEPIFGYHRESAERAHHALTFGLEVEVENVSGVRVTCGNAEATDRVDEVGEGRVYCKHDGSLNDYGFEIVSHPGTLAHHMYVMHWKGILRKAQKAGRRSHDARNCGLHVHVGRAEMGETAEERARVCKMMQIMVSRFRNEWTVFSRRASSAINQWAPIPEWYGAQSNDVDELRAFMDCLSDYSSNHSNRYTAVNITNRATVEIRIFRGTLKRDTLIAAVQACENLTRWCMEHSVEDIPGTTFADVVLHTPYREIVEYMRDRGLLSRDVTTLPGGNRIPDFATGRA